MNLFKRIRMNRSNNCFLLMLSLLAAFAMTNPVWSQTDGGIETISYAKLTGITATSNSQPLVLNATAPLTYAPQNQEQTANTTIQNIVMLSLIEETPYYLATNFSADVTVRIDYGENASTYNSITQTLTITWDKNEGTKYNAKNYFSFAGAKYVNVTVTGAPVATPSNIGSFNLSEILLLQNEMRVNRFFELINNATYATFNGPASVSNPVDAVPVSWSWPASGIGNNYTQLEWTWLEDELAPNYYIPNTTTVDETKLFEYNSTRLDLPLSITSYNIPLFYDGVGKLYYRIRPVTIKGNGSRSDGAWCVARTCSYGGHNNDLNWQVRTSFAEDGKLKSVMEYYDGSLRSRQTVTKENVNNTTITAESFYDYEGRPSIQILPAPGINTIIQYQANLNMFNGQTANQNPAELFDLQPLNSTSSLTPALATTTGTSRYYSPSNDEINVGPNKNIPDAEGYPYTVTRYTPDATGRIMAQSGVGPAHKMSSTRETKYYYGTPAQEELDGLFGTEVGNYTHYFKNMVKDANGQMSVSYTDMHGRTIATALAGDAPSNLLPLDINNPVNYPNQAGTTITRNLLNAGTNVEKGNSIESINTILVPATTTYNFQYSLAPDKLQLTSCTNTQLCYDCMYDLEVSITDESGDLAPMVWKFTNVSLNPDDDCNTATPALTLVSGTGVTIVGNTISFSQQLQPGSYAVRKTLTLSEASFQNYKAQFLTIGKGICKTEQQLIDSVYNVLVTSNNCGNPPSITCQACLDELGTYTAFRTAYLASLGNPNPVSPSLEAEITAAFNAALASCNSICNNSSATLSSKRQLMLADMMPYGGQYATESPIDPLAGTTMYDKYNIFSNTAMGQPFYKNPWDANKQLDYYRTDAGVIDETIHPGGSGYTTLNNMTKDEFAQQFTPSWANALLPHHPEYDRLVYAETNLNTSYNWMTSFNATGTYAEAQTAGYIMTSNPTLIDPFYTVAPGKKPEMVTWLTSNYANSNLSLWMIARGELKCKNIADPGTRQFCYNNYNLGITVPPFNDVVTTADKDEMWKTFRNLYAAARDNQVNDFIATTVPLADDNTLIAQKYQLRFGKDNQTAQQFNWTWYPPSPGSLPPGVPPTGLPPSGTGTYTSRCQSYIDQWKTSLLQCTVLANLAPAVRDQILTEITNGMVTVCINGSDAANPYGSSTVNPSYVGTPRSFEEVINQVYAAHGINPPKDYYCNPYVIEFPKPYGKNSNFIKDITTQVDSCACARFSVIASQASGAGYNPSVLSSINQYLLLNYQDTLTPVLHQALLNCGSYYQWVCDTILVDSLVSCYDPDPCVTDCLLRPAKVSPTGAPITLNTPGTCSEWTLLISCFYETYGATVNTNPANCQSLFISHFNSWYGVTWTWKQIASAYFATCGSTLNVCTSCTQLVTCHVPVNCHYQFVNYQLPSAEPLPDFLKCGFVPKKCLTCDTMVALTAEFKSIISAPYNGGPNFTGSNLTDDQIKQNILYARFLNFRTGFQYTWMEYAKAAANVNCSANGGGVVDLVVTARTGNTPQQYIASNSITFDPNFDHPAGDDYETLLQANGGGGGTQTVICPNYKPLNDTTGIFPMDTACHRTHILAIELGQNIYQQQQLQLLANFEAQYRAKCMAAKNTEAFTVQYFNKEYHYTLYYYDNAGGLVKTIPPKGVHPDYTTTFLNSVKAARNSCSGNESDPCVLISPAHVLATNSRYNSLKQLLKQNSPDAGTSKFWYDRLGRSVVSQNAQQAIDGKYSYTLYDGIGRITETGQKTQSTLMTQAISQDDNALYAWIISQGGARDDIAYTVYDLPYLFNPPNPSGLYPLVDQKNLRNRVSYTATKDLSTDVSHKIATFYSYDIHGNVDTLLQDFNGISEMQTTNNRFKMFVYKFDLISSKILMMSYQPDWYNSQLSQWVNNPDKFFQKYEYDAENKVTSVYTSRDRLVWEKDAYYTYYKHGPLARTVLGQLQVQGTDYAYTIQGQLKGVNGTCAPNGSGVFDIGHDGMIGGVNTIVARDIIGYGLHYFDNGANNEIDYKSIGAPLSSNILPFARPNNPSFVSLFNGNVGGVSINNIGLAKGSPSATNSLPLFYNFRYDQLNRIITMGTFNGLSVLNNTWSPGSIIDYTEATNYDPNGNILSYNRKGSPSIAGKPAEMDELTYNYYANKNQLRQITDVVPASNYPEDIDNQTNSSNYTYDAIGNLKTDVSEDITNINWSISGKASSITKGGNTTVLVYDAINNRVVKRSFNKTTIYVRDVDGNVISIYEKIINQAIEQVELDIYGSGRIGTIGKLTIPSEIVVMPGSINGTRIVLTRGEKAYELVNHTANILATITDKKIQFSTGGLVEYYISDIVSATDYFPFGMEMPGRTFGMDSYRYGYNGKEKTDDISLGYLDFEERIYSSRIARWLSVDPQTKEYPWQSPYAYHRNSPIVFVDWQGGGDPPYEKNNVHFVPLHDPFVTVFKRNDNQTFTEAAKTVTSSGVAYTINMQLFDRQGIGKLDYYYSDGPLATSHFPNIGLTIADGKVFSGKSSPLTFYFAQDQQTKKWSFGQGDPPTASAIAFGGAVPIIINGLSYGESNIYKPGAPSGLPTIGPPGAGNEQYLEQRSNAGFPDQNSKSKGKSIVAFNSKTNMFLLITQEDGKNGMNLDEIRNYIKSLGYDNALSFDGSGSAGLVSNSPDLIPKGTYAPQVIVQPDGYKDNAIPGGATFFDTAGKVETTTPPAAPAAPVKKAKGKTRG